MARPRPPATTRLKRRSLGDPSSGAASWLYLVRIRARIRARARSRVRVRVRVRIVRARGRVRGRGRVRSGWGSGWLYMVGALKWARKAVARSETRMHTLSGLVGPPNLG